MRRRIKGGSPADEIPMGAVGPILWAIDGRQLLLIHVDASRAPGAGLEPAVQITLCPRKLQAARQRL